MWRSALESPIPPPVTLSVLPHPRVRWHDLRALALPASCAFLALLLLLALGAWQVQRLHWKDGILARIDAAEAAPPVPLRGIPDPYQKVEATGRFRPDRAVLFGAIVQTTPQGDRMGGDLIVPLERTDGPPVLVDRGWVPDPVPPNLTWPAGEAHVSGYALAPQTPGIFTPAPDKSHRRFYALDPAAIAAALGLKQVAPFTLIAMGPTEPGHYPMPATRLPRPPNNHFQYAVTWFGLAGALLLVFFSWAYTKLTS